MIKPINALPAGQSVCITVVGRFVRIKEASHEFRLKVGTDVYTLEGGDEFDNVKDFRQLTFINTHATDALYVAFFASPNVIRSAYVKLPRTKTVGADIVALANNGTQNFPGVNSEGKRRKQFTCTIRSGLSGRLEFRNADTGKLLGLLSTGAASSGGFALETDENIRLTNKTGGAIDSTTATPDIAIAETFYR